MTYRNCQLLLPVLMISATLLQGCGGEETLPEDFVPLEPSMVFTAAISPTGEGTTGAELKVRNNTTVTITNITVDFTFPAGVMIEGGSAGGNCGISDGTASGYRIRSDSLAPGGQCSVNMELYANSSGPKTFSVQSGALTADSVPANDRRFTWSWTAP